MTDSGKKPSLLRKILKWLGRVAAAIVLLALGAFGWAKITVARMVSHHYDVPASHLVVSDDPAAIARGDHLAHSIVGCAGCHGPHFTGFVRDDIPNFVRMGSPNITRGHGGVVSHFTVDDWEHAIRHGVKPDGTAIMFMPSDSFQTLSDEDTAAVIAYMRTVPPVDDPGQSVEIRSGAVFPLALGLLPFFTASMIDHQHMHHPTPAPDDVSQGRYMIGIGGCRGCHGEHLSGGPIPGAPPSLPIPRNLTPDATGLRDYAEADFVRAVREGRRKDGVPIDQFMPWDFYAHLTDSEIHQMWVYLRTVPPRPFGGR